MDDKVLKMARSLQHSIIPSVSQMAKAYLDLVEEYKELRHKYVMEVGRRVMKTHHKTLKKLADSGD